ncbi:MAG: hypothetical protein AAGA09_02525 [Pseudomonadota bacterium]
MTQRDSNLADADENAAPRDHGWSELFENVKTLAIRKSGAMVGDTRFGGEPEDYDARVRTLRTLMSAADIAQRLKRNEREEQEAHDPSTAEAPILTDEAADEAYDCVMRAINRAEERAPEGAEESVAGGSPGADAGRKDPSSVPGDVSGAGAENLGGERP